MERGGESEQEGGEKHQKNIATTALCIQWGKKKTYRTNKGRSGQEKRKAGERESSLKEWSREEGKETVISHAHPYASLCTGHFDNFLSSKNRTFKRSFL